MNVTAGFMSQVEGMNEGISPALLKDTAYARGINVVCRGGHVATRPGFVLVTNQLPAGVFQGAGRWSLNATDYLVGVSGGVIFVVRTDDGSVASLGQLLDPTLQCFFSQADKYMVIQNGTDLPVVLGTPDGIPVIVAVPALELPKGTIMQYAHGRLHYVPTVVPNTSLSGRPYLISSDIAKPNDEFNMFKYTEGQYLNEGGAHGLPMEMGFIGGLGTIRNAQTGTGVGEVLVFARNGVSAFDFSLPRSFWSTQPLSSVLFFGNGTVAPWSICNVNNDVVYRALDGMRSIRYTSSNVAGSTGALSNNPLSVEAQSFFRNEPIVYQQFVSSSFVDNRLFMTAGGTAGSYFKGIVSLDTAVLSAMGQTAAPAYDGAWTGYNFAQTIMAVANGKPTQFVFTQGPVLYRMDETASVDQKSTGEAVAIKSTHITGAYSFSTDQGAPVPFVRKMLDYTELWVSGLTRDTNIKVYYRPGGYPFWALLGERNLTVPPGAIYPQYRQRIRIARENNPDFFDPITKEPLYSAYDFQFAIVWEGRMTLERFKVSALALSEATPDPCDVINETALTPGDSSGIVISDFNYSVEDA